MGHLLQAMHPYDAESEKELSFSKGDFIVVRKVYFHLIILFILFYTGNSSNRLGDWKRKDWHFIWKHFHLDSFYVGYFDIDEISCKSRSRTAKIIVILCGGNFYLSRNALFEELFRLKSNCLSWIAMFYKTSTSCANGENEYLVCCHQLLLLPLILNNEI